MFDNVYDNGEYLLGKVENVINHIHNLILEERIDDEYAYEILDDMGKMKPDTIISIYYNHPMGYTIDYWAYNDIVNKP
jgi:hypothetical protein